MAHLVVLLPAIGSGPELGPAAAAAVARIGATSVSPAGDGRQVALVLEGRTFDPARGEAVLAVVGVRGPEATLLQPLTRMTVSGRRHIKS